MPLIYISVCRLLCVERLTDVSGYVYALLYSYFESFPLVYGPEGYDFPGGVEYLPFAALLVGEVFSFVGYALWAWYVFFTLLPSLFLPYPLLSRSGILLRLDISRSIYGDLDVGLLWC